jgi:hypothetical protein
LPDLTLKEKGHGGRLAPRRHAKPYSSMIGIVSAAGLLDGMLASPFVIPQPSLGILLLGQISPIGFRFALVGRDRPGRTGLLLITRRDRIVVSLRMSHAIASWDISLS